MKHFFRDGRGMVVSQSRVRLLADDKDLFSSPIEPNESRLSTMSPSGLLHFVRNDEWEGTHTWGILRRHTKRASAGVAGWFGMASGPGRTMVHTCSTVVRVLFGCCSSATRSPLEAESNSFRRSVEAEGARTKVELALTQPITSVELGMNYQTTRNELRPNLETTRNELTTKRSYSRDTPLVIQSLCSLLNLHKPYIIPT